MGETSIEWTDRSINPLRARNRETGAVGHFCEKVSAGCSRCYAETWNLRVRPSGTHLIGTGLAYDARNRDKVEFFLDVSKLEEVLFRRKPTKWFWCDMTDLFGAWVPDAWIDQCVVTMLATRQHTHQLLTKRADRMRSYWQGLVDGFARPTEAFQQRWDDARKPIWRALRRRRDPRFEYVGVMLANPSLPAPHIWNGVSVEGPDQLDRIDELKDTPSAIRFVSFEPLLENVGAVLLDEIHWGIAGAESGRGARHMDEQWVRSLCCQHEEQHVAFFYKQNADSKGRKISLPMLDGKRYAQFPGEVRA